MNIKKLSSSEVYYVSKESLIEFLKKEFKVDNIDIEASFHTVEIDSINSIFSNVFDGIKITVAYKGENV